MEGTLQRFCFHAIINQDSNTDKYKMDKSIIDNWIDTKQFPFRWMFGIVIGSINMLYLTDPIFGE